LTDKSFLEAVFLLFGRKLAKVPPFPAADAIIKFNFATNQWELSTGGILSAVQSSSNVGTGAGLALARVIDDLPFKSLLGTANEIILTSNPNDITFSLNALVARLNVIQTFTVAQTFNSLILGGDMDADGFDIKDLSNLEFRTTTGPPPASLISLHATASGLRYNVGLTQNHIWFVNGVNKMELDTNGLGLRVPLKLLANGILVSARATGDLLKDNGTNLQRFARGTALQQLRVNAGGNDVEYFTPSVAAVDTFLLGYHHKGNIGGGTRFMPYFGNEAADPTESKTQEFVAFAFTVKRTTIRVGDNTRSDATTFTFRKNGADESASLISVPAATTGSFDTGDITISVAANDLITEKHILGGGTGVISDVGVLLECRR